MPQDAVGQCVARFARLRHLNHGGLGVARAGDLAFHPRDAHGLALVAGRVQLRRIGRLGTFGRGGQVITGNQGPGAGRNAIEHPVARGLFQQGQGGIGHVHLPFALHQLQAVGHGQDRGAQQLIVSRVGGLLGVAAHQQIQRGQADGKQAQQHGQQTAAD